MKYTILGCITHYSINDIKPYVNSITQNCGDIDRVMLVYDVQQDVIEYLKENNWKVVQSKLQEHIILQRFRDVYALLKMYETDVVIWTDVKDIVFQNDPRAWLGNHMHKDLLAFSECVKFQDDDWAVINTGSSFPIHWDDMKTKISYCAGTIVGKSNAIRDLFINIYRWTKTTANPDQLSDQAAYNVLINQWPFLDSVQFVDQEEGFATQLGTVWAKAEQLNITEPTPKLIDGKLQNQNGATFSIVHQYDRDEKLKELIINQYNG